MGTSLRKLNIFVSCPSDVTKYRDAVYKWSAERRKHYERDQGIFVNVTSFKEVPTGLALDGEQALIDDFYKDQFDIYLGLMAARFGTPTKNFGSGTEQEYYQAINKILTSRAPKAVLFEFSNEKIDPYTVDWEQFSKVKEFKQSLAGQQVYFEWDSMTSFREKVSNDLEAAIYSMTHDANWAIPGGLKY